jgi:hypothetical protein
MVYALVQRELDTPSRDALRRAFERVPQLTVHDVSTMARGRSGILIERMGEPLARAVQRELMEEGVRTVAIDHKELFLLPSPRQIRRAAIRSEGFVWYDPMERERVIGWEQVTLVAAGLIGRIDTQEEVWQIGGEGLGGAAFVSRHEVTRFQPALEIFFNNVRPPRFRIDPRRFNYAYLERRMTPQAEHNFLVMVRDIIERVPHAMLNRGADSIASKGDLFTYPTQRAFDDEIVWRFWKLREA